ncbi:MAG: methyltransferase domain-containing protein [Myxococcota bacterium]
MSAILLGLAPPEAAHHGHKQHGHDGKPAHGTHGNPADMDAYIAHQEEPTRAEWQKPDEVVRALGLKPGQTACDVGAGPGYFSLRLARAVGSGGQVYAVDVEPRMLETLLKRISEANARNVTPVLALPDDPLLPAASCDVILVVDTFHHFPDGVAYLRKLRGALKPGGKVVNIDFHKKELPVGPPQDHLVAREDFLARASAAGLVLDVEHTFLAYQYFLVLKPK